MSGRFLLKASLFLLLLLFLILAGFTGWLSFNKPIGPRHEVFEEPVFDFTNGDFSAYRDHNEATLRAARLNPATEQELQNMLSFMLTPPSSCPVTASGKYSRGLVLTHGLIASPHSMRSFAEDMRDRCFFVVAPLLPDHGTRPGDMLDSHWEKWAQVQHFATSVASQFSEEVWVSGHSVGGTLAMYEAANNPDVDGMILFAPALGLDPALKYAGLVSTLSVLSKRAAWYEIEPDLPVYRYESFPIYAGAQTYELIRTLLSELEENPLTVPLFMVGSEEDTTVDSQALLAFVAGYEGPQHTVWYAQTPEALSDKTRELAEVVPAAVPDNNILSLSHLGLMTPASHDFYGEGRGYYYCGHYYPTDLGRYERCLQGEQEYYGEITAANLAAGQLARITWNPHYTRLLESLDQFLDQL